MKLEFLRRTQPDVADAVEAWIDDYVTSSSI
jgi:hypothetical protein